MSAIWAALAALVDPLAALLTREKVGPEAESPDEGELDAESHDSGALE